MRIADAHCDTLFNQAIFSAYDCVVTPASLSTGNVALQTYAMFAGTHAHGDPQENARIMFRYALTKGDVPLIRGALPEELPDTPHAILSIEGGEVLKGSLETLRAFDDRARIRLIALTWNYENEIGFPAVLGPGGNLKPFGKALLREMDRRGILCDVSHLNEDGFWDAMERASLAPVASHSCCRWLCDTPRNLKKEQAKAIIQRKGFIGINFYTFFLTGEKTATIDDVVRHIEALMELGGEDVVGFGSDFDGIETWPEGLSSPACFPSLLNALAKRGYAQAQIEKIAGLNYLRVLREADKARCV